MPRALREHWLPWLVWNYRVDGIPIYHLVIASTDDHSVHVCKSTFTDAACTHQVSNCWDVLENNFVYPNTIELSWAREAAVAGECFNKTVKSCSEKHLTFIWIGAFPIPTMVTFLTVMAWYPPATISFLAKKQQQQPQTRSRTSQTRSIFYPSW